MKTLLFAPCWLDGDRLERNLKWLKWLKDNNMQIKLQYDEILLVDNASHPSNLALLEKQFPDVKIIKRTVHLTRWKQDAYPYWYVAFARATDYALKNGFEKIIHLDTDVYPLNNKVCDYVRNTNNGWVSMWCEMHKYPESTFQIINRDQLELAHRWFTEDFLAFYPEGIAETRIPWTYVEKRFNGDRFGEKLLPQNPSMDWYGQTPNHIHLVFND